MAPGWDWSLPPGIKPVPYSGFTTWGKDRYSEMITVQGIFSVGWRQSCPAPGDYDWKPMRDAINHARSLGMRVGLHIRGVERPMVPDWVIKKYNVPVLDVAPIQENQPWRLQIVPPWHPDVLREYAALMEAFGKTGIPQSEDVVYGYIHGISPSRGEEWALRPVDIEAWEKTAGLTADLLANCLKARVDGMLKAFHGVEYKLAFMGGPIGVNKKEYLQKTGGLLEYALVHGTGWRGGRVDFQHSLFQTPALGSSVTPDGYCVVDENLPIHKENRYCGDENEEYGKAWEYRFGPVAGHAYRHRLCVLKTLLLGQNFQVVSPATLELNPELNRYALLSQGRHAEDSPDAFAYLRECAIKSETGPLIVKNLERWLIQRDVEGHRSVACERVDRYPLLFYDLPDRHWDYDARRTDLKNGQTGLAFRLATRFWPKPGPAVVKITFTDREHAVWHIEHHDASGTSRSTGNVQNFGDGQRKTATFRIDSLSASRSLPGQMDFKIVTDGPGDVTVTLVRVVKA